MLPHGAGAVLHEVGGLQVGNVELDGKRVFVVSLRDGEAAALDRIVKAVGNLLCVNDDDSLIVRHIEENTPENAIVFLTGIGKCYPLLRSHKVLNNLSQSFGRVPVVLFFPGTYDEQSLILFDELKDDNYYRAFRLVKP